MDKRKGKIMTAEETKIIKDNILSLEKIVIMHGQGKYKTSLSIIQDMLSCIADEGMSEEEKQNFLILRYQLLFPPRGGLSDFMIHHDDFDKRKELNAPLENAGNRLWDIFRKYT